MTRKIVYPFAATPLVIAMLYLVGYFALAERVSADRFKDTWVRRSFRHEWLVDIYQPAARLESWYTGWDVQTQLSQTMSTTHAE